MIISPAYIKQWYVVLSYHIEKLQNYTKSIECVGRLCLVTKNFCLSWSSLAYFCGILSERGCFLCWELSVGPCAVFLVHNPHIFF